MLETAYKYSLFTEGVFLLDKHGNKLLTYPPDIEHLFNLTYIPSVNQVLQDGKPVISDIYTIEPSKKKVIFVMTPLKDKEGNISGIAGGLISPTNDILHNMLQNVLTEPNTYVDIIDSNEIVVASDKPEHVLQHHNHGLMLSKMIKECRADVVECKHGFRIRTQQKNQSTLLLSFPFAWPRGPLFWDNPRRIFSHLQ
jgi:hypothetical protein